MRFTTNGPWLPDELLTQRDNDQVLFFCGAGVSKAEANLPDFTTLARDVLTSLGSALDSPARKLFNASHEIEEHTGVKGLIPADRIFGQLEQEFEPRIVREAVAVAIRPSPDCNLAAHRTLLDLSRNRAGKPRLVTTNFDRLFELCEHGIPSFNPPHLPDPRRPVDFRGVIHLHGRVTSDYSAAEDEEFVLSSADFGHAYLSDGWATRYIQTLLQRFQIVFVGYSADDPPVQYLLEALTRFARPSNRLYAFQAGDQKLAATQWAHKGVEPITYDSADGHAALWATLSVWAERARDVDGWHDRIIAQSCRGPSQLSAVERGMFRHLVATDRGAMRLARTSPSPPAEWLFVIDPNERYATPFLSDLSDDQSAPVEPFSEFGLDDDEVPAPVEASGPFAKREIPQQAWDGFIATTADLSQLPLEASASFRSLRGLSHQELPLRLQHLAIWLTNVAHEPAALWWAAGQAGLHAQITTAIRRALAYHRDRFQTPIRLGWQRLLDSWENLARPPSDRYQIEHQADVFGWTNALVRQVVELYRPAMRVSRPYGRPGLATIVEEDEISPVRVSAEYPEVHGPLAFAPHILPYAVAHFRKQLELAVELEAELNGHDSLFLDTTRADDGQELAEGQYGLTGLLATFINLVEKLIDFDVQLARNELACWTADDTLFARLRIWASSNPRLTSPEEAAANLIRLGEKDFWSSQQERDLLFALRDRWAEFSKASVEQLEHRLLTGRYPSEEAPARVEEWAAAQKLSRFHWLAAQGVVFSFDIEATKRELLLLAPQWTTTEGDEAAKASIGEVFSIRDDTSCDDLALLPLSEVIPRSRELGKRDFESRVQRHPFRGLATENLPRALRALTLAIRSGEFARFAWRDLLLATSTAPISMRAMAAVLNRVSRLSSHQLAEILPALADWLKAKSNLLLRNRPDLFELGFGVAAGALEASAVNEPVGNRSRRWLDEALNRPTGKLVDAVLEQPDLRDLVAGGALPVVCARLLDRLLSLAGDSRKHAIAKLSQNLNWLFHIDPQWVGRSLLPFSGQLDSDEGNAFWAGYLAGGRVPQATLYSSLKPQIVKLAARPEVSQRHLGMLAIVLLEGWRYAPDDEREGVLLSSAEFREVLIHAGDNVRCAVVAQLGRRAQRSEGGWSARVVPFLKAVWPRQRALRNRPVSSQLARLPFHSGDEFPRVVEAVLPLIITPEEGLRFDPAFMESELAMAGQHPRSFLQLLVAVLPKEPRLWPYRADHALNILAQKAETADDPRLTELRHRARDLAA